jgi:hypothetical protein
MAHQARAIVPEPSQALFAGRGDALAEVLADCALGRADRWRSRAAVRPDCGEAVEAEVDRFGAITAGPGVAADSAAEACPSGLTQSATGSVLAEGTGAGAGVGIGMSVGVGVGVMFDVAKTFVVIAFAVSADSADSPVTTGEGRLNVHAPQASATMPMNASEIAMLR